MYTLPQTTPYMTWASADLPSYPSNQYHCVKLGQIVLRYLSLQFFKNGLVSIQHLSSISYLVNHCVLSFWVEDRSSSCKSAAWNMLWLVEKHIWFGRSVYWISPLKSSCVILQGNVNCSDLLLSLCPLSASQTRQPRPGPQCQFLFADLNFR